MEAVFLKPYNLFSIRREKIYNTNLKMLKRSLD